MLAELVTVDGSEVPEPVAHIARDPLDPLFDRDAVVKVLRRKHSEIKRQLLDQTVVSGIGNIYADEALWRAKVNGARLTDTLSRPTLAAILDHAADVMRDALGQGGTSFDSLYVNVNGGYRLLRPFVGGLRPRGGPVRTMRRGDAAGEVHEPLLVLLPEVPATATGTTLNDTEAVKEHGRDAVSHAERCIQFRDPLWKDGVMTDLWVERTGVRRYTGRSSRGAEVLIGSEDVEGVFTPGELLKIALAACSGMSSDHPLRSRLGDDYEATIRVSGPADREQERYPLIEENLEVDLSELTEDEANKLRIVVERSIDKVCTVGRTLKSGTEVTFGLTDEPLARRAAGVDGARS